MDNDLKGTAHERFETDIENLDAIVLKAADILYELDFQLQKGEFDLDTFRDEVLKTIPLDETRKLLFDRAIERYRRAIDYTRQDHGDLTWFLRATKLNLSDYDTLRVEADPSRPGVFLIRIQSQKDAVQFDKDIEDDFQKALRNLSIPGLVVENLPQYGRFLGKSVTLESLGLPKDLPLLRVIVVCEETGKVDWKGVADHEYSHAIIKELVWPFVHKYLAGSGHKNSEDFGAWMSHFSDETRGKLEAALGDISTTKLERLDKQKGRESSLDGRGFPLLEGVRIATHQEQVDGAMHNVLFEEQYLMDEMRAYGFSHQVVSPTHGLTRLAIRKPERPEQLGVMDPKMVQRYLRLHLLTTRAYFQAENLFWKVQAILGVAQTLDQATRLIEPLVLNHGWNLTVEKKFIDLINMSSGLLSKGAPQIYSVDGDVVIPNQTAAQFLMPPKAVFEKALHHFYGEDWPEWTKLYLALYQS